ncbi:hypothetical protein tb265_44840 [Gemmatimonadetes bacterium T265]|nr:hypothetical protein tb265_44840 [Gemmatimonadetes bacterium T265]
MDEYTRECLHLVPDASWPSGKVAAARDVIAAARGAPARIVLDNGAELAARALDAWAYGRGVELAFTRRGKPVDNCYVESFHDKFRDECLSTHWFLDLADARCQQHRRRGQIQRSRSGHITRWARHLRRAGVGRADQPCGGAARGSSPRGW